MIFERPRRSGQNPRRAGCVPTATLGKAQNGHGAGVAFAIQSTSAPLLAVWLQGARIVAGLR
jgi:hypothetical protein